MTIEIKTVTCGKCGGSGELPAADTGRRLRKLRDEYGVPLQRVADSMGYSRAYLNDLEKDKRKWSKRLLDSYVEALEKLHAKTN